ncbi:MAG: hypothetical protein AB7S26_16220 [Sandaracinaceae bacterium]
MGSDAGTTIGGDVTAAGPRTVSVMGATVTRGSRSIPVSAHVPDGAGPYPLVLMLPGFQLESSRYAALCDRVASHGYVVVRADPMASLFSADHTAMRDDAIAVLDWAPTAGLPIGGDTAVMGHSLGGKLAVMVAGMRDVAALLAFDPVNGGSPLSGYTAQLPNVVPSVTSTLAIPVGYLGETTNATGGIGGMACAPTAQNYATFFDGSTMATWAAEWTFAGADHMDFVPDTAGCGFTCSACPNGTANQADVLAGMYTLTVAFLERHLRGRTAVEPYLTGAMLPAGVTSRSR